MGTNVKHKGLTIDRVLIGLKIQLEADVHVLETLELPSWRKEYSHRWVKTRTFKLKRRVKAAKLLISLFDVD